MWREDDWFMDLPTDGKLLWIYLFSNPSASVAGIYRLSLRTMANETGLSPARINETLAYFDVSGKAHFRDGVVWVVKMREHQQTRSKTVQERIAKDVASIPKDNPLYGMYCARYPIDTVSIPIATDTDTDTVTDTETDTIQRVVVSSVVVGPSSDPYRLIASTWEQRMGQTVTPILADSIRQTMRSFGVVTICDAIELAAEKGNPRWAYVEGILRNWQNEGRPPSANGNSKPKSSLPEGFVLPPLPGKGDPYTL